MKRTHRAWIWIAGIPVMAAAGLLGMQATEALQTPGVPPEAVPGLYKIASAMASWNGDASAVGSAVAVASSRENALAVITRPGVTAFSDEPVYVVTMTGHFVGEYASVPPGQPLPTGTVLHFTVAAATGDLLDWGISDRPDGLGVLGPTTSLTPAAP